MSVVAILCCLMIWAWIGFMPFVLAMLSIDLGVFHRRSHVVDVDIQNQFEYIEAESHWTGHHPPHVTVIYIMIDE